VGKVPVESVSVVTSSTEVRGSTRISQGGVDQGDEAGVADGATKAETMSCMAPTVDHGGALELVLQGRSPPWKRRPTALSSAVSR
jgi:hypothetical protein